MKVSIQHQIGLILLAFFSVSFSIHGTEKKQFNIYDYTWLTGYWVGDGFGGISEEIWSQPSLDSTMIGMYRHMKKDGSTNFYEFMILNRNGLRLKHFSPDLTGWEEKEKFISFEMTGFTSTRIEMKGISYELKSDTEMEIHVDTRKGNQMESEVLRFKKIKD